MGQEVSSKLVRYIHYCSTGTFNPQVEDDDDEDDEYHHVIHDPRLSLTSTTIPSNQPDALRHDEPPESTQVENTDKSANVVSTNQIDVANESDDAVLTNVVNQSLTPDQRVIVSNGVDGFVHLLVPEPHKHFIFMFYLKKKACNIHFFITLFIHTLKS